MSDETLLQSELLVVRWQLGDRTAFASIIEMWEKPLFYYLRRLVTTEADAWDSLQETWLKVFRSIRSIRDPRSFPAFLYQVARNTAISRIRATERQTAAPLNALEDSLETGTDEAALYDRVELVHHALNQLPLVQREAMTLYFLRDLSLEEIASLTGVSLGTVKSRLHYGKLAIRKIITKGEENV